MLAQSSGNRSVLTEAHDRQFSNEEFLKTTNKAFLFKIYTIENAIINKTHHWFFQLTSINNEPLNFATITLSGYLKDDPSISFTYGNAVFPLCTDGKYIIGFVKVKQAGTWVLQATIDNFGENDRLTYEIEIEEKIRGSE